jgi:hypothetical protein
MTDFREHICVGFEVLKAVVMKSSIFWGIMPRSLFKVNRRFGGTFRNENIERMKQVESKAERHGKDKRRRRTSRTRQETHYVAASCCFVAKGRNFLSGNRTPCQ